MKSNIVVEENENHQSGNSKTITTACVGSSIEIDSVSINLANDIANCEHFSIRGYVSRVRQKDWRKCWPFPFEQNPNISGEQTCMLPPIEVPKSKWWHCHHCRFENGTKKDENNHDSFVPKSNKSSHEASLADVSKIPSKICHSSKLEIVEARKFDADTSSKLNTEFPPCRNKKENRMKVAQSHIIGHEVGGEIPELASVTAEYASTSIQRGNHADETAALSALRNGSGKFPESGWGHCRVKKVDPADRNLNLRPSHVAETCRKSKEITVSCSFEEEHASALTLNAHKRQTNRHPSVESDEFDCTTSGIGELSSGNEFQDQCHHKTVSLHPRKPRKVRLLTDLLSENGDKNRNHVRVEESSSNAISHASAETRALSAAPQDVMPIKVNDRIIGQNRKRKFPHNEESGPMDTTYTSAYGSTEGLKRDAETAHSIPGPELEINRKSSVSKFRTDKSSTTGNKKIKKNHPSDEVLSLGQSRLEAREEYRHEMGVGCTGIADNDISFKSVQDGSVGRKVNLLPLLDESKKSNSSSTQKKNEVRQFDDWKSCSTSRNTNVLREGPIMPESVQTVQNVPTPVNFQLEQSAAVEKGMDLSNKDYLGAERINRKFIPRAENELTSLLTWQTVPSDNQARKKDSTRKKFGDYAFKPEADGHAKAPHFGFSRPFDLSHLQQQDLTLNQDEHIGSTSNCKNNFPIHEYPFFPKTDIAQPQNTSEHSATDDIPMEIVELMAKNQYERRLPDTNHDKMPSEMSSLTRNFIKPCGSAALNLFREEPSLKQGPALHAKNERNGTITVGSAKRKSAENLCITDRNHPNTSQLDQSRGNMELKGFPQCAEDKLSGFPYSEYNSSRCNGSENCKWTGDMIGNKKLPDRVKSFGSCYTCPGIQQKSKEPACIWPSTITNNLPFLYNVAQMHAKRNLNRDHGLNFLNQNVARVEKHKEACDFKYLDRSQAEGLFVCKEKMMRPLDVYAANDTIPAMHLLSLMDAGLQSSKPINIDAGPKFIKKSSILPKGQPDFGQCSSYDLYMKNKFQETLKTYPTFQTNGAPAASSFQHNRSFTKPVIFPGEGSWKSQEKIKRKSYDFAAHEKGGGSSSSLFAGGDGSTATGSIPSLFKHPRFDPMVFPAPCHGIESLAKNKLEAPRANGTLQPAKKSLQTEICCINKNPADFSLPEAGNVYTIGGQELKFKAPFSPVNRPWLMELDGRTEQPNLPGRKQQAQHKT